MSGNKTTFRVGSRKSELALIQTNIVIDCFKEAFPNAKYEIVSISTIGDQILDRPLPKIGEKALFTKELEIALVNRSVDFVVHSLKDMPTSLPPGLAIGAILKREDPRDAVILHKKHSGKTLDSLPENSIIGTSSLRRRAQLKCKYPHLVVKDIRGNLQTRREKLNRGDYDGIVLALAGIMRMGWDDIISQVLETNEMLYAVGQGALAVECREEDCSSFSFLNDERTVFQTIAERGLLNTLGGGCSAPVAVSSKFSGELFELTAAVWSLDGSITIQKSTKKVVNSKDVIINNQIIGQQTFCGVFADNDKAKYFHQIGIDLADDLTKEGALKVIEEAKIANLKDN